MIGAKYKENNDAVQVSFQHDTHFNLAVTTSASNSPAIDSNVVLISLTVAAHVNVKSVPASTSDFVLAAGLWPIKIIKGAIVSVIQLTGGSAGQASVIIPEV